MHKTLGRKKSAICVGDKARGENENERSTSGRQKRRKLKKVPHSKHQPLVLRFLSFHHKKSSLQMSFGNLSKVL